MTTLSTGALFLEENIVNSLLTWPLVYWAVDQALRSVSIPSSLLANSSTVEVPYNGPISSQTARTFTKLPNNSGVLLSMPGYIGNYMLNTTDNDPSVARKSFNTLACKLVTSFPGNSKLSLPTIMATIVLMDPITGRLTGILESTELTGWRTAAASLVATQHLYFDRKPNSSDDNILAIIGCGVQGRYHAIGMCSMFKFDFVYLWNRSPQRATALASELETLRSTFRNPKVHIVIVDSVRAAVLQADIIVTATYASTPIVFRDMLKPGVHINGTLVSAIWAKDIGFVILKCLFSAAVGAGINHHSELDGSVYSNGQIYVDTMVSANVELSTLQHPIVGEVGEVMLNVKKAPASDSLTIFQSMGMAVEDAAVAQAVFDKYRQQHLTI